MAPELDLELALEPRSDLEPELDLELALEPRSDLEPELDLELALEPRSDLAPELDLELPLVEPRSDLEPELDSELPLEPDNPVLMSDALGCATSPRFFLENSDVALDKAVTEPLFPFSEGLSFLPKAHLAALYEAAAAAIGVRLLEPLLSTKFPIALGTEILKAAKIAIMAMVTK